MENDVLITEENMFDRQDQDLKGMEATLKALDIDFTPDPVHTPKSTSYKKCRCGNALFESPKGQFRCGLCGNIQYKKNKEGI
ncbi:hypothetical protein ES707_13057 [subsurface metagenome]|jgi:hypothetical protein